jgi:radical SAM superfamily enzyme YgiQ (UPF0313 family)
VTFVNALLRRQVTSKPLRPGENMRLELEPNAARGQEAAAGTSARSSRRRKKFLVELIKPSHYDDDGYVIQWWRGFIPSSSLSCLYGLALEARHKKLLGDDVEIVIEARDESNSIVPIRRIIRRFRRGSNRGIVCLVGVQTNQYPRALEIAKKFRAAGIQVAIGGFHVSGCIAMLPELTPELKEALELGITLFAGEAEGRLGEIFRAAYEQRLQPLYDFTKNLPNLEKQPVPFLPKRYIRRCMGMMGCFDAGRGCPFSCSFCTIINVQGRTSRFRTADDVEVALRANNAQGVRSFMISDDNFARSKNWEEIFDRIIELRAQHGLNVRIMIQVDILSHKIRGFVTKAARAGCDRVFIGLESINPDSLRGVSKGQNRITEYRRTLQAWHSVGVITYAGYILGFPADTPESIARDIAIIQKELPIDMLHFFVLTPLPGSKDHLDLLLKGARLDPDLNRYDTEHPTTDHPLMATEVWERSYKEAWRRYYSWDHIETLFKRAVATDISTRELATTLFHYYASQEFEGVHHLQSGIFRRKLRSQRRPGFTRENALVFYWRRLREIFNVYLPALWFFLNLERLRRRIDRDPMARSYIDLATTPAANDEKTLELYKPRAERSDASEASTARTLVS